MLYCRSPKAAAPKPSHRKRMPVKIKIKIMKEQKTVKPQGENGQRGKEVDNVSNEEEEEEMGDDLEDQDYSPHEPSRHGLKKVYTQDICELGFYL